MLAAALDVGPAAAAASLSPPLLVALLLVPGIVVLLCLDFWRLCRRDPDARDAASTNGRHSVLVGNASFVWKKGPDKKTPPPAAVDVTSITAAVDDPTESGGGGGDGTPTAAQAGSTAEPVPDIAAELPYLLPADSAAAAAGDASRRGSSACGRTRNEMGDEEDYQSPGGELPYHAPADQLRNSETVEEEPYYAVPVHRASQPAPLPPPRRRQARVT